MRVEIVYRFQNPFQTVEASAADQTDSEQVDSQS